LQRQLVESYQARQVTLVPIETARAKKLNIDWQNSTIDRPSFTGVKVVRDLPLTELVPYIDWSPFFMAWELKGKYPKIFDDPHVGAVAKETFADAQRLLKQMIAEKRVSANGVYGFWPANSVGDDIVLYADEQRSREVTRFHTLRQQWEREGQTAFRALSDYIAPLESGRVDYLGAFAVTAGVGADEWAKEFVAQNDDHSSIMVKAIADRLAEAFAEYLHAQARRDWGYGQDEGLTNEQLIEEKYRGIRPAAGYPSQPDHTEKRNLFDLLQAEKNAGIELTESFAMTPAASVSGLYFAHPQARYFAVDRITRDQLEDYARRKKMPITDAERWLAPNLGYDP